MPFIFRRHLVLAHPSRRTVHADIPRLTHPQPDHPSHRRRIDTTGQHNTTKLAEPGCYATVEDCAQSESERGQGAA